MNQRDKLPKNIIISHVYSRENKGDAALTSVLVDDLRRKFPKAALRILTLEAVPEKSSFEGVPEQPSFMHFVLTRRRNPLLKLAYMLYMIPATLFWAVCVRYLGRRPYLPGELLELAELYATTDLIVGVGGGYIRSRRGLLNRFNIPLLLHPLLFSHILGKPTVLYSQSVGPFMNRFEELLVGFVLKRMTLVLLREDTSVRLLSKLGVSQNVVRSVDSGFLLRNKRKIDVRRTYGIPAEALVLGVTVRSWLKGDAQQTYERAVARALDAVTERFGAHILFIPQVTADKGDDDRLASRRVHRYMQNPHTATVIEDQPDHHHIKSIYDELDVLLGTRFHSVIFSLTSFVPVLAIEYEHKTSGIMRDLGLEDWVIKIEEATAEKLTSLLQKLIKQKTQYQAQLKRCMPPYVRRAEETVEMLAETYFAFTDKR